MKTPPSHQVIAIDGPAASGKSTIARLLARRLGYVYVNTGAMYRTVTWLALQQGIDPRQLSSADPAVAAAAARAVVSLLEKNSLVFGVEKAVSTIRVQTEGLEIDPTSFLDTPEVTANVSAIAALPRVREFLVARQREFGQTHDLVMEGRDIGTVVFPGTRLKAYIDASAEVRAARRRAQGIQDDLSARDQQDSTRAAAPLQIAPGAEVIDSTYLSVEETVDEVIRRLGPLGLSVGGAGTASTENKSL